MSAPELCCGGNGERARRAELTWYIMAPGLKLEALPPGLEVTLVWWRHRVGHDGVRDESLGSVENVWSEGLQRASRCGWRLWSCRIVLLLQLLL